MIKYFTTTDRPTAEQLFSVGVPLPAALAHHRTTDRPTAEHSYFLLECRYLLHWSFTAQV